MIEKFYTDEILKDDPLFKRFLMDNPTTGYLKVRASSANEAVPISGLNVKVYKDIGNYRVIFFEGVTDYSGMINNIQLPAPMRVTDDLVVPNFTEYKLEAYNNSNLDLYYDISVCCNITVIQYINITPSVNGMNYGN